MNLERERFNEWIKHYENHDVKIDQLQRAFMWQAWLASASREGYKLVPVDFLKRCDDHLYTAQCYDGNSNDNINKIIDDSIALKAMLGAVE